MVLFLLIDSLFPIPLSFSTHYPLLTAAFAPLFFLRHPSSERTFAFFCVDSLFGLNFTLFFDIAFF